MNKKIVLTQEQADYVKQELLKKRSCTSIRKELNIGEDAFRRIAHEIMGDKFDFRHGSYVNLNYFSKIDTPEKAYWLGFIAADGAVSGTSLSVQLQAQDKQHLQKFSDAINGNLTIQEINGINNFGTKYQHYRIAIKSQQYIDDLKQYNITNTKSMTLKPPKISDIFIPYWIMGIIDGDGSITYNRDKIRISITGTKDILKFIRKQLNSKATISLAHRCKDTYTIYIENQISEKFLKQYDYINLPFVLERKRKFAENYFHSSLN